MTTTPIGRRAEPDLPAPRWSARAVPKPAGRPRLLLADDHDLLLEAFRRLLEPEFTVVRGVTDGEALVEAALELRPDAVLCDIAMPRLSGLQAARRIHDRLPGIKLIFLTMHNDPELAAEAFRTGASGYVLKSSPAKELLVAIRTALAGEQYLARSIDNDVTPAPQRRMSDISDAQPLSPRGQEVLRLLAGGRTMKETAARLGITPRTVAFHKYRIMQQLSLRSSAELVQFAVRRRIV
jgi:DNA-binding NarL/FixJ family response regulator